MPVYVLSNSMACIPYAYRDKAEIVSGPLPQVVESLNEKGFINLYIDGGKIIQSFLQENLIDEMTITRIPLILGGGIPLFSELTEPIAFEHLKTKVQLNAMVQSHYRRKV